MKTLLEIAGILTRKKIARIEILDEQVLKQKDSKFGKFYEGLLTGKIETDEDAASLLYENGDTSDAKYRQIKSRFRRRLLNTLFFLDVNTPAAASYEQAYISCNKELTLVEILLSHQANHSAAILCRQILTTALKFNFTELILKTARHLRRLAVLEEDEKGFNYYNDITLKYALIYEAELQAEHFSLAALDIYQRSLCRRDCIEQLSTYANQLVKLSEKHASPRINFQMFYVWSMYYELLYDYEGVLEVCSNAKQYFDDHKNLFSNQEQSIFTLKTLSAYFHLNKYEEGRIHAENNLTELSEEMPQWIDFMEYYLLLSLKTLHIINAIAIFNKVTGSVIFKKLDEDRREKWELFEAALHYLIDKEKMNPMLLPRQRRKTFKVSDFINRPVNYPARLNILYLQRLTFQILFLLQRKSHQGITERIQRLINLSKYELKKEGYERAYFFVKQLQQLEKSNYSIKNLRINTKYLNKIKNIPFIYRGKIAELEVLPYEQLWQFMIQHLE
ncbi:MAG: hypothetical protein ACK4TA_10805 [Saprospiraceae bacterium]